VELDRQSIERRDFPIARRGYDPAAVDAHLRALAVEAEELERHAVEERGSESLGSAAASQVRGILEAAESTAADIERQATEDAARMREEASLDAQRTRAEAIERAQAHVAAVAQATAVLRARVESMDGEVAALVQSLQAGAGRLASDLASVEVEMGALYDAAAGRGAAAPEPVHELGGPESPQETVPTVEVAAAAPAVQAAMHPIAETPSVPAPTQPAPTQPVPTPTPAAPIALAPTPAPGTTASQPAGGNGDLDGARLVALNMALNGESREQADRYLAENFQLADRAKLLDEVYAAIEV
jgi:DivIVA domain-containing protein